MENESDSFIVNSRGYKLYCRYWEPKEKPKAIVFVSHGFTEHSYYYQDLATMIADLKCLVLAHDHVGHGRSEGPRVQIESIDQYVDDVFQHIDMMKQKFPDLPVFYFGHSMGGAIGALAAIKKPDYFAGVVLCGPALVISPESAGNLVKRLGRMIGWMFPNVPILPLNYDLMTRDPDIMQTRKDDPLSWHGYCKAGWMYAMLRCIEDLEEGMKKLKCPVLLVHGDDDKICEAVGSRNLYDKCPSTDKTLKIYPNAYHNLLEEPEGVKEKVREDIKKWLTERIQ